MTLRGQLKREIRFRVKWTVRPRTVYTALLVLVGVVLFASVTYGLMDTVQDSLDENSTATVRSAASFLAWFTPFAFLAVVVNRLLS